MVPEEEHWTIRIRIDHRTKELLREESHRRRFSLGLTIGAILDEWLTARSSAA